MLYIYINEGPMIIAMVIYTSKQRRTKMGQTTRLKAER